MKGLLVILFLVCVALVHAQQDETEKNYIIEQRIELLSETLEQEDVDYTTVFDQFDYFFDHPINLNNTSQEELRQLYLLNDVQISALLVHIEVNGKLLTIYELQSIDGFTVEDIRNIRPFVKVSGDIDRPHITFGQIMENGSHEFVTRMQFVLEDQEGLLSLNQPALDTAQRGNYLGDPYRLFTRYRFRFRNNISWGFTAEKDPGEEFFQGTQKNGYDYYSAHFYMKNFGVLKALAIGDYHAQFGQGLTFWTGLGFGKSSLLTSVKKNAPGLRPYASVDENNFLRGAATTLQFGKIELTSWYSNKKIDGNLQIDTSIITDEGTSFTSFQTTGYHRNENELFDKDAIGEMNTGGNLRYVSRKLSVGATAAYTKYDTELNRNLGVYNQFDFNSNENLVVGFDYNYLFKNINFFGETSRSQNGGLATINGLIAALDHRFSMTLLYRNFSKEYQQLRSMVFADGSRAQNEKGLFWGIEGKLNERWTISGYFDGFESDWLRYQVDGPSRGYDVLGQIQYKPSRSLIMYFRARHRQKPRNTVEEVDDIDFVDNYTQTNYRYNITYKVSDAFTLRNRVEWVDYTREGNETERGFLIYQDILYKPMSSPWSASFRYALFDTDTYNSRLYAYENDVLYYYYIPAYYNRGSRTYLTLRYKIKKGIDVWLRWAQWIYDNEIEVNTGLNTVEGVNTKTEIKLQFRVKF